MEENSPIADSRIIAQRGIGVFLAAVLCLTIGICIYEAVRANSLVYVDNAGDAEAVVFVDGVEALKIPKRSSRTLDLRHGVYQIRFERENRVVFDRQLTFATPGWFEDRKYLVNPQRESGYWVAYLGYKSKKAWGGPGRITDDPPPKTLYGVVAEHIELLDNAEFIPLESSLAHHVLHDAPPQKVRLEEGKNTAMRTYVRRMDRREYELLQAAPERLEFTKAEFDHLRELVDRLESEAMAEIEKR